MHYNKQYIHRDIYIRSQHALFVMILLFESVVGEAERVKCIRQTSYKGFGKSAYILSIISK